MKQNYLKRITAPEQLKEAQASTATQWHEAFTQLGLPAPETTPGEDASDYLSRVPIESLAGLVEAYEVMEP